MEMIERLVSRGETTYGRSLPEPLELIFKIVPEIHSYPVQQWVDFNSYLVAADTVDQSNTMLCKMTADQIKTFARTMDKFDPNRYLQMLYQKQNRVQLYLLHLYQTGQLFVPISVVISPTGRRKFLPVPYHMVLGSAVPAYHIIMTDYRLPDLQDIEGTGWYKSKQMFFPSYDNLSIKSTTFSRFVANQFDYENLEKYYQWIEHDIPLPVDTEIRCSDDVVYVNDQLLCVKTGPLWKIVTPDGQH